MPNLNRFLSEVGRNGFQKTNWFEFRLPKLPPYLYGDPLWSEDIQKTLAKLNADPSTLSEHTVVDPFSEWLAAGLVCSSISLPGRSFATADQTIYGFERKTPYQSTYNPLQCTFVAPISPNGQNTTLSFFQRWQNTIQDTRQLPQNDSSVSLGPGAFDMQFPEEYYGEGEIVQYSYIDVAKSADTPDVQINLNVRLGPLQFNGVNKNEGSGETVRQVSLRHRFAELYPISVEATPLNWASDNEFTLITVSFNYSYWVDMAGAVGPENNVFSVNPKERTATDKFFDTIKQAAYNAAIFNGWIK